MALFVKSAGIRIIVQEFGNFPKKSTIINIISKSNNTGKKFSDIIEVEYPQFIDDEPEIVKISKMYKKYKQEKDFYCVVKGLDKDGDGKIDDIKILETITE